jgi:hypothetical protein
MSSLDSHSVFSDLNDSTAVDVVPNLAGETCAGKAVWVDGLVHGDRDFCREAAEGCNRVAVGVCSHTAIIHRPTVE